MSMSIEEKKMEILEALSASPELSEGMDIDEMKAHLLEWLGQMKFPDIPDADGWSDCVRTFPPQPGEPEVSEGIKVRLAFRLYTAVNQYLVSIIECLNPDEQDVYILSAHVNWNSTERETQRKLDEAYAGQFVDNLRTRHTVWIQTFRKGEMRSALDATAIAILAHELVGHPPDDKLGKPITLNPPTSAEFPLREDS